LDFGWDEVHEQADILEHVISEKLEERMAAALNYPNFDPHGDPIPSKEGRIVRVKTIPLAKIPPGNQVVVSRIPDDADGALLRYLADLGLIPGIELTVLSVAPFDGPLTLKVNSDEIIVGHKVASAVLVEII
jgi:DtxR family Mn-dependent transcriptional regulator